MLVRDQLHLYFLPWIVVGAVACTTDARTPIVSDAVDTTAIAVTEGEVKVGWADKAYVGMTRGEFLKAYATDVIKEEDCWNYGIDGGESMGMLVERDGEPWLYAYATYSDWEYEVPSPTDTIKYLYALSPQIKLFGGVRAGMTAGELATAYPDFQIHIGEMDEIEYGWSPSLPKYTFKFAVPISVRVGRYREEMDSLGIAPVLIYEGIQVPEAVVQWVEL